MPESNEQVIEVQLDWTELITCLIILLNLDFTNGLQRFKHHFFKKINSRSIILIEIGYDGVDAGIRPRREYDDSK